MMLGISTAFNRMSLAERRQAFALPGPEAARRFVEAEFVSSRVGPPVNVVEISSGGIDTPRSRLPAAGSLGRSSLRTAIR